MDMEYIHLKLQETDDLETIDKYRKTSRNKINKDILRKKLTLSNKLLFSNP